MYFVLNGFLDTLFAYEQIIIYGNGMYAHEIWPRLLAVGLGSRIKEIQISGQDNGEKLNDVPIVQAHQNNFGENTAVLLAVSKRYEEEIKEQLEVYQYKNIVCLADYVREDDAKWYIDKSFEEYFNHIAEWYAYENAVEIFRFDKCCENIKRQAVIRKTSRKNDKKITFITGPITARIAKIIGALVKKGYVCDVIKYRSDGFYVAEQDLKEQGILIASAKCVEEVLYRALFSDCGIFYVEAPHNDCFLPVIMLEQKEIYSKLVLELYDVCTGVFTGLAAERYEMEKQALEKTDGIVWRYFIREYLEKEYHYHFSGCSVQLLDYCDDNGEFPVQEKKDVLHDCLKICTVPSGLDGFVTEEFDNLPYVWLASCQSILKKIGGRKDCVFHVYTWSVDEKYKEIVTELENKYPNFKVYIGLRHKDLVQELQSYDYGFFLYTNKEIPPKGISSGTFHNGSFGFTEGTFRYCVGNKFFDYIEAGIPIVTTLPEKLCDYFDRYGVLVKMNIDTLDIDYLKEKKSFYKKQVIENRQFFLMDNHIDRLIDFFNEVLNRGVKE